MKKILSIMLATVMLVSLFAINASAIVLPHYTVVEGAFDEAVAVDQQYDGTNTIDFVEGSYGNATVTEDGALNVTAKSATNEDGTVSKLYAKGPIHLGADFDVERNQYVVEFDLTKNDDLVGYQSEDTSIDNKGVNYGVYFTAKRPANEGTYLETYNVFIPLCMNTTDEAYSYKIVIDEAACLEALEKDGVTAAPTSNADRKKYGDILMSVYHKAPGATDYTQYVSVTSYALTTTLNGKIRFEFSKATAALDPFNLYFCTNANSDTFSGDDVAPVFNFDQSDYTIDNLKVYCPEIEGEKIVYDNDFISGDINVTDEAGKALDFTTNSKTTDRYYFAGADATQTNMTAVHSDRYALTFDAVCDVVGQPLTINLASDTQTTCGTHIKGTEAIKGIKYTYKIFYENVNTVIGRYAMSPTAAYRKAEGSDTWEAMTLNGEYVADYTGRMKSDKNFTQFGLNAGVTSCGTFTEGAWTVSNIQVVPDTAISGHVDIVDGNLVADVNIGANSAKVAYAATYFQGRLVDIDYLSLAETADSFELTLPYSAGTVDAATLYVWDNSADPELDVIDLLSFAQ